MMTCLAMMVLISCGTVRNASQQNAESKKLQEKYSRLLGVSENEIVNLRLYRFADDWLHTPYKYGGKSQSGVDCSSFTIRLLKEVFEKEVCCTSSDIYKVCSELRKENLKEGDLVFFKINSKSVSHVGVYLANDKFIHASTHAGVVISDLNEQYYRNYYFKGGRVK